MHIWDLPNNNKTTKSKSNMASTSDIIYDDLGVMGRYNPDDEDDWRATEPYCFNCGHTTGNCDCGDYRCGTWFDPITLEEHKWTPPKTEPDVVFCCSTCKIAIIRDSEAHDLCVFDQDGDEDKWYCVDCGVPSDEELPKCDECDCGLTEDDEKYWCNSRGEYICEECHSGAEKCDDEGCDCCAVEDDE